MEKIDRTKINWEKIRKLPTSNDLLDKEYGVRGTKSREKFAKEARAYYYGQIIEDERRKAKLTQEQLAEKIGANKSYISRLESGKTEPKVSTFYKIMAALGLTIEIKHIKTI